MTCVKGDIVFLDDQEWVVLNSPNEKKLVPCARMDGESIVFYLVNLDNKTFRLSVPSEVKHIWVNPLENKVQ